MKSMLSRRKLLKTLGPVSAIPMVDLARAQESPLRIAGMEAEIQLGAVGANILRVSVVPVREGKPVPIPLDGSLVDAARVAPAATLRGSFGSRSVQLDRLRVELTSDPLTISVQSADGRAVQKLQVAPDTGSLGFRTGTAPLLGLGEGGPQFDRRGSSDPMRNGQGGYRLKTHGGRVPIQWLVGTDGWALLVHQPTGWFDLRGEPGWFQAMNLPSALPLDVFLVTASDPAQIMAEYARLTGLPEAPPLWSFGYHQSRRTLASREEVLAEARTFREKKLPCDTFIYLGTGFCPSGWNTENGSFSFNRRVFDNPAEVIAGLHKEHLHVALHSVILAGRLRGGVHDPCDVTQFDEEEAACYWDAHRKTFALGVDGWWPDEGDPLDAPSRLARIRMYWEGPQLDRPHERPFALHRNGHAGMQRYGAFLWSGDVSSTWETLRTHIPIAINTGLSGIPYWGTDIGGFVPTKELTGELYVRWFQFAAFCPLFRAHGRAWKLRLPWGWNTGETGPKEISGYGDAALPDESELHNAAVEPICRQYLELRYRMLPYLYNAVRESCRTGLPIMRALWLHYPDDPAAVARSDEYLWGRDILVAPVVEKGATSRRVYLPRGAWYDYWTGERRSGGQEIDRAVDLAMTPIYIRAGAILPLGPVKQYVDEPTSESMSLTIYPGADGSVVLYEDDGRTFAYRNGEWQGTQIAWQDQTRKLDLRLAEGARLLAKTSTTLEVKVVRESNVRKISWDGGPLTLTL
jgi:alpha-glucosidase (family GH31 glycosyl hydrolase)